MESVTRSDVLARSMPDASESRRTEGSADIEVSTSHPASDIYSNACADSVAVLEVVRPISMAAASSFLYSSAVAFAVAAVDDIAASNSFPVFTLYAPTAAIAVPAAAMVATVAFTASPAPFPIMPRSDRPLCALFSALLKLPSSCPAIFIAIE